MSCGKPISNVAVVSTTWDVHVDHQLPSDTYDGRQDIHTMEAAGTLRKRSNLELEEKDGHVKLK